MFSIQGKNECIEEVSQQSITKITKVQKHWNKVRNKKGKERWYQTENCSGRTLQQKAFKNGNQNRTVGNTYRKLIQKIALGNISAKI